MPRVAASAHGSNWHALIHFATIPMSFEFPHWGEQVSTSALPRSYIAAQLLVRLPEAFLLLLVVSFIYAAAAAARLMRDTFATWRLDRAGALRAAVMTLARARAILTVC